MSTYNELVEGLAKGRKMEKVLRGEDKN